LTSFIFRFFEFFCEDASCNKLCMSTNFIIFGPMDQKLWMFEVLGEVWAGRACDGANEVELIKVPKSGGRRRKNGRGKEEKWKRQGGKNGAPAQGRAATRDRLPAARRSLSM
jgi:hypothetical protein